MTPNNIPGREDAAPRITPPCATATSKPRHWSWALRLGRRNPLSAATLALLAALLTLAACAPQPPPPISHATPTPLAPLAPLPTWSAGFGYQTILTLGNVGQQRPSGSFVATSPYLILFMCDGSGDLTVSAGEISQRATCSTTPTLNGMTTSPATNAPVQVAGFVTNGPVQWTLTVESQV